MVFRNSFTVNPLIIVIIRNIVNINDDNQVMFYTNFNNRLDMFVLNSTVLLVNNITNLINENNNHINNLDFYFNLEPTYNNDIYIKVNLVMNLVKEP